jgi:hypothetical protein
VENGLDRWEKIFGFWIGAGFGVADYFVGMERMRRLSL